MWPWRKKTARPDAAKMRAVMQELLTTTRRNHNASWDVAEVLSDISDLELLQNYPSKGARPVAFIGLLQAKIQKSTCAHKAH